MAPAWRERLAARLRSLLHLGGPPEPQEQQQQPEWVVRLNGGAGVPVADPGDPRFRVQGNHIATSKYTLLTFFPVFLFELFTRVAYLYFLLQVGRFLVDARGGGGRPLQHCHNALAARSHGGWWW